MLVPRNRFGEFEFTEEVLKEASPGLAAAIMERLKGVIINPGDTLQIIYGLECDRHGELSPIPMIVNKNG